MVRAVPFLGLLAQSCHSEASARDDCGDSDPLCLEVCADPSWTVWEGAVVLHMARGPACGETALGM